MKNRYRFLIFTLISLFLLLEVAFRCQFAHANAHQVKRIIVTYNMLMHTRCNVYNNWHPKNSFLVFIARYYMRDPNENIYINSSGKKMTEIFAIQDKPIYIMASLYHLSAGTQDSIGKFERKLQDIQENEKSVEMNKRLDSLVKASSITITGLGL